MRLADANPSYRSVLSVRKQYIPPAKYRCVACRSTFAGRRYMTGSKCPSCGGYLERVSE